MTELEALVPVPGAPVDVAAVRAFLEEGVSADDLEATPQDEAFHAEGNVWIHTQMVLDALVGRPAWRGLDPMGRMVTFLGALLHDVGKPATTRPVSDTRITSPVSDTRITSPVSDTRITSRGHSARGEHIVRRWLWQRDVPFGIREHVCALVRHHQVPFFGVTRPEPDAIRTAGRLSLRLRNDWLALVAEADARGRRCADPADQERMLDHTALWIELCREVGCLDRPRPFASDHTRVLHFEAEQAGARVSDTRAYDDTRCEVVVMVGLPAAGKDRWLAEHRPELPVVSLDALREELEVDPADAQGGVIAAAREAARGHLRAARSFAWNATNLGDRLRAGVVALARGYRARVHLVYCEASVGHQVARNRRRANPVPRAAIDRMLDRWTVPALDEAHQVTFAVDDDGPLRWPPPG